MNYDSFVYKMNLDSLFMAYQATAKTAAKKAQKYEKIISVTKKQIAQAGFSSVSMANIAAQAEVATGTLYRYFSSKQALCTEVFCKYTDIELTLVEKLLNAKNVSPAQKLTTAIEVFAKRAMQSRHLAWSLIVEPLDPGLEAQRIKYRQAYCDLYSKLIDEGIKVQQFRPQLSSVSAAAIVGALAESLIGPLSILSSQPTEKMRKQKVNQAQVISNIVTFCLQALGYQQQH